ncbi:MAG: substrate-binding domain-containing protein [Methylocystaceae bacterium]|nr:substrate-binding domain-containing protein [Methylocystaceae bacterium]
MNKLIFLFVLLFWSVSSQAESHLSDYYSYQEFMQLHPKQKEIADRFSDHVKETVHSPFASYKAPLKVAIIYPGIQASDYWRRSVSSFEARLREHRLPYEIRPYFTKPAREIRLQEKQINEALAHDPDYLVFTLDAVRHEMTLKNLIKKGRPKIIIQNATRPVKSWGDHQPFFYVGFDHEIGSEMLAEKFMALFPRKTEYAMFYGSHGFVSTARGDTFENIVKASHGSTVAMSYYLDFDRERARKAALHLISRKKLPRFIFACSTDIALGVIDAAKESNMLDKVSVNGWGGGGDELAALAEGSLKFTVMRMNDDNGVAMADAIAFDQNGQGNLVPQVFSGEMVLLDQNMSQAEINALQQRAFRYSDTWRSSVESILTSNGY